MFLSHPRQADNQRGECVINTPIDMEVMAMNAWAAGERKGKGEEPLVLCMVNTGLIMNVLACPMPTTASCRYCCPCTQGAKRSEGKVN